MFSKFGAWFDKIPSMIGGYLAAHPVVKNFLTGLMHAAEGAAFAYIGQTLYPGHTQAFTLTGLFWATAGGAKAYAQNQHDVVLAQLQDQIQAAVPPTIRALTTSSALTPPSNPVSAPTGSLGPGQITTVLPPPDNDSPGGKY